MRVEKIRVEESKLKMKRICALCIKRLKKIVNVEKYVENVEKSRKNEVLYNVENYVENFYP